MSIVNEKDIDTLTGKHSLFQKIFQQYGQPPSWSRPAGFISLSKIILEQQVSLASANAHFNKLNNFLPAFTPENILRLTDEEMFTCQISRQKAKYLRALSTAIVQNEINLDHLHSLDEESVRSQLTSINGIGHWTADIYLMFCLQAKDIFPIGDVAIVNSMKELTLTNNKEDMLQMAKSWRPLRSLASYFLWHSYLKKRNRVAP